MYPGALLVAFFAAGALATPVAEKRDVYTKVEYYTEVVTVTAGPGGYGPPPSSYPKPPHRHGHKRPKKPKKPTSVYTPPAEPTSTYKAPAETHTPKVPSTNLGPYADAVVRHHNVHRSNHSAPDASWDQGLADTAMKIAQTCRYAHSTDVDGGGYGQNIAAGVEEGDIGKVITDLFYNSEVSLYPGYNSEPDMGSFHEWGHFSQVVWCGSQTVGCATFDCSGQGLVDGETGQPMDPSIPPHFTVCNYKDAGNYGGEYSDNVKAPKGDASVDGSY